MSQENLEMLETMLLMESALVKLMAKDSVYVVKPEKVLKLVRERITELRGVA